MAVNSETEMNLKTLQRVDSNIVEIIDNASQVAIYKYERMLNKWECTDIEGTLFLYKRSVYPYHGFIIVNRMSTTNFVEAITNDMDFIQHEPYFLYKKSCGEIIGSWFYEQEDFRRITNKIQSIVLKQSTPPRRQRCSSDSDSQLKKDDAVQDIMSMLSEAHTEYIENDILPSEEICVKDLCINATVFWKNPSEDIIQERKIVHQDRNTFQHIQNTRSETSEPVPAKNIKEDFNDLSTYSDKKLSNKSVKACPNNFKSPYALSSYEKYPVSPRRRFLSTGSYDSPQQPPFCTSNITNELIRQSKGATVLSDVGNVKKLKDKAHNVDDVPVFPLTLENVENFSTPTRLSPLFSQDEISSPALSGIDFLDQTESVETPVKPNPFDLMSSDVLQKTDINGHYLKADLDTKAESNRHSSVLKETLKTHMQFDSDIMLKIHEAYIGSLKSMFSLKKC